jgi:hypothetical protein
VLLALAAAAAKAVGGLLTLALVRPWGRVILRGWGIPAVPTESITLRDGGHGSDFWPPSATR